MIDQIKISSIIERHVRLRACKYINEVISYITEKDLINVLSSFKIDLRIIVEEYKEKKSPVKIIVRQKELKYTTINSASVFLSCINKSNSKKSKILKKMEINFFENLDLRKALK